MSKPVDTKLTNWPADPHKHDPGFVYKKAKHKINQHEPPQQREGMHVKLSPIRGLTDKGTFHSDQKPFLFQCPPQDPITITFGHDSEEYETVYDGTFSTAAAKNLTQIEFTTLFVEDDFPGVLIDAKKFDPWAARSLLERLSGGTPFLLTCSHVWAPRPEWHGAVTLTDYVHTEQEPYAYYADVTFKHYRDPNNPRLGKGKDWPIHHKLTSSDTLYSLAKKYYGKTSEARGIARANHITTIHFQEPIVHLGGRWKVGTVITLPKPDSASEGFVPKAVAVAGV